jgi:hypothetical protein
LEGIFLTGVALVVVEEAALVAFFNGVDPAAFVAVLTGFDAGALVVPVAGFLRTGSGFVVPRGVRVRAGFEASLTVFFEGVVVAAGLLAEAVVTGFFTGVDVAAGVAFVAIDVVFAGVEADAPAELSFFGTLFTGVAAELAVLVAFAAGFFTGVALAADVAVFAGAALVGFFAVDSATLATFPTLAENAHQLMFPVRYVRAYIGAQHSAA